jgi:SecD/SecF fusion protein
VFLTWFHQLYFNEVSDKQINKGLDLEGGINVILKSLLKTYWKDYRIILKTCFNKSLADATANLQGNKPFIDKFLKLWI